MKVKTLFSHALRSSPWPLDSVKSLYHIDGGGCDYAKGTGSSAQRLHAILADRSCRTQGPGDAPPVCTGASCAQGYQRRPCAVQRLAELPWPEGKRIHLSHRQRYTPQPEDQGSEEVPRQNARKPPSSPGAEQSSPSLRPPRSSSTPSPPAVASSRLHVFSRDRHRVAAATTPCRPLSWPLSVAGRLR